MEDKTFFYPNCCHVCKGRKKKLISCPKCQMISYCSKQHRQEHSSQHEEICAVIKGVLGDKKYMNTEEISAEKWKNIRNEYIKKVSDRLHRELKNEEIQMFQYAIACVICNRQDAVIPCKNCPSAASCDKHRDVSINHFDCQWLEECFEVDNYLTVAGNIDTSYIDRLSDQTSFHDMEGFLDTCLSSDDSNKYLRMLHSNALTYPLTVYFCIKKLDYLKRKMLSIHIIGRQIISVPEDIERWKMLLILIRNLTTLTITFIQRKEPSKTHDIPTEVVWKTKKLVTNVRYISYAEYMRTTEFKKPNFIVGFNADVNDRCPNDKCVDISALVEKMCPCILVFDNMISEHNEMLKQINNYFYGENPFMNNLVRRCFLTQSISYPCSHLIILNDLDSSKLYIDGNCCLLLPKIIRE